MRQEGHITEAMAKVALANPARVHRDSGAGSTQLPPRTMLMDVLADTVGAIDQDLVVTTTLDHNLQSAAEHALTDELAKKGSSSGFPRAASWRSDPMARSARWSAVATMAKASLTAAIAAKRQPGSSFKPFVYLTGLEHGLTPDTVREDGLSTSRAGTENYSREYFGPVTLTKALSLSLNTVAVRVAWRSAPRRSCARRTRLGITFGIAAQRLAGAGHVGGHAA